VGRFAAAVNPRRLDHPNRLKICLAAVQEPNLTVKSTFFPGVEKPYTAGVFSDKNAGDTKKCEAIVPGEIEIGRELDVTLVSCSGLISVGDLADLHARLTVLRHLPARVLIDLQKANLGLPYPDIEWFARLNRPCARVAIFAPRPLAFGISRMYQMLSTSGGALAVFSDRKKALAWLRGLDDEVTDSARRA